MILAKDRCFTKIKCRTIIPTHKLHHDNHDNPDGHDNHDDNDIHDNNDNYDDHVHPNSYLGY